MNKTDLAESTFKSGFNCSQSIIGTYGPEYGLSNEDCIRISSGFGGGMRRAEVCGAVTGAIMVIGLRNSQAKDPAATKDTVNAQVTAFTEKFENNCGSILCRDLLGCDISTAEGKQEANAKDTSNTICPGLVRSAAEILEMIQ